MNRAKLGQRIVLPGTVACCHRHPPREWLRFGKHAAAFASDPLTLHEVEPGHFVRAANIDALMELAAMGAAAWN